MKTEPLILQGEFIRLVPLQAEHSEELYKQAKDADIWRWTTSRVENYEDLENYVAAALNEQKQGISLPFAAIEKTTGTIVGSTRFGNIDVKNRRVEIGWTWFGRNWQRTAVNTEAKYLMLKHAFEIWQCIRVELKTDVLNEKSRKAIFRIGAKQEGILRQHLITDAGRIRDTVYYSIINSEWESVKANLELKLKSKY